MKEIKLYEYRGEAKTLGEWARTAGLPLGVVRGRLRRGWTFEELMDAQNEVSADLAYRGETYSIEEWFRKLGLDAKILGKRLADGSSVKKVLLLPKLRHPTHPHARRVLISGSSKTIAEWAKVKGVDKRKLRRRLDTGWLPQLAVEIK